MTIGHRQFCVFFFAGGGIFVYERTDSSQKKNHQAIINAVEIRTIVMYGGERTVEKRQNKLGDVVKQARQKNDVTAEELADRIGVSVRYIYRIESGDKKPSYDVFLKLMEVLAINSELVCHPEKPIVESKAGDLIRMLCHCDNHTQDVVIAAAKAIIDASLKD